MIFKFESGSNDIHHKIFDPHNEWKIKSMDNKTLLFSEFHKLKFFQKLIKHDLKKSVYQILSKMEFENFEENEILFYQGDPSKKFYIILKGSIFVLIKNKKYLEKGVCPEKIFEKHSRNPKLFSQDESRIFLHQIVNEIKEGEGFGELGIIQNSNRLATLITKSKCLIGSINSETFRQILSNTILTKIDKKLKYFRYLFNDGFTNEQIYEISAYFKKKKFIKGNYIFKQNQVIDHIFIIFSGEVMIQKQLPLIKENNTQITLQDLKKINNGGKFFENNVF